MTTKIIETSTSKCELLFVEGVPEGYYCRMSMHEDYLRCMEKTIGNSAAMKYVDLPSTGWQLIGRLSEVSEDDAEKVVEKFFDFDGLPGYYDYPDKKMIWTRATESLHSLATSLGVTHNAIILIRNK